MSILGISANSVVTSFYNGIDQISKNKGTILKIATGVAVVALGVWLWNQGMKEEIPPTLTPVPSTQPKVTLFDSKDPCLKRLPAAMQLRDDFLNIMRNPQKYDSSRVSLGELYANTMHKIRGLMSGDLNIDCNNNGNHYWKQVYDDVRLIRI